MRVLHVLNAASGGATMGAVELMRASREARSDLEHFVVHPGATPAAHLLGQAAEVEAVPMRWWNKKTHLSAARRAAVYLADARATRFGGLTRRRLSDLVRRWGIDVVHTNTAATVDGATVARRAGIPHVWHIRERIGREGFMRFPVTDDELVSRIASASNAIVPMSRYVGEIFDARGQRPKAEVVYDAVDARAFGSADERGCRLRRSWGIPDDAVLVGKVAAVTSGVKRHEVFLRAAAEIAAVHPETWFVVAGKLPGNASWARGDGAARFASLRRLARSLEIEDRLVWAGHVSDAPALMTSLDVVAHACEVEGFGRFAIEAMAASRPVVAPRTGGVAESVVDGSTGVLVAPCDPHALAEGVSALVADAALRKRLGEAGRERAVAEFSPARHLEAMSAIFERAVKEGPTGGL